MPTPFVPELCIVWTKILRVFWLRPRPNQLTRALVISFAPVKFSKVTLPWFMEWSSRNVGASNNPLLETLAIGHAWPLCRAGVGLCRSYKVRRSYDAFTLLDVELKTGRTHQIRVHLAWLKHPVVADELYGGGRENSIRDVQLRARIRKLKRQFLHAEQLGFRHPDTGEPLKFVAPLPAELTQFLELLEGAEA